MIETPLNEHRSQVPKKIIALVLFIVLASVSTLLVKIFFDDRSMVDEEQRDIFREDFVEQYQSGDYDSAILVAESLINDYPEEIEGYIYLANAYVQKGSVDFSEDEYADKAIEVLEKALDLLDSNTTNPEIYRLLGYSYEIKEQYDKALSYYGASLSIDPTSSLTLTSRGHLHSLLGEYDNAEEDYIQAISSNPENYLALVHLASIYLRTDVYNDYDVESMLHKVLANSYDQRIIAEAYQLLGDLYLKNEYYIEALEMFTSASEYDERLVSAWMGIVFADIALLSEYGDDDEIAGEMFDDIFISLEKTLTLNKNQASAYMAYGILAGMSGETEIEKSLYETALELIDFDITLGLKEKESLRTHIDELILSINSDDPLVLETKKEARSQLTSEEISSIEN